MLKVKHTESNKEINGRYAELKENKILMPFTSRYYDHKFIQELLLRGYEETATDDVIAMYTKKYAVVWGIKFIGTIKVYIMAEAVENETDGSIFLKYKKHNYDINLRDYILNFDYTTILNEFINDTLEKEVEEINNCSEKIK